MTLPIDSLAVAEDGTVRIDVDVLRLALEALEVCSDMDLLPTPQQIGRCIGRSVYAHTRVELWLRDCAEKREEVTA